MSNFPNSYDDDTTLPVVNDNLTQIGGLAINALRDFAFNIENYLGLGLNGTTPSLAVRLGVSINPDGTLKSSAIASMGLVTLPITQDQIAPNAGIPESKLKLDYRTGDLFNYIRDLSRGVNNALGWISTTGDQLEPHLIGALYRHSMDQIDVSHDLVNFPYLNNVFRAPRNNGESYLLVNDINNELLAHQWADGSPYGTIANITTNDGSVYPSNYAHVGSGVFIDTARFQTIPQNDQDVQSIFEYIDQSSILLLGTRIQNLYANGISVDSRSSSLITDGYGQPIVPVTPAITYLLYPSASAPVDSISFGDDMIQFQPTTDGYVFDEQFALVNVGDIIRVNYGTVEVSFRIREKKYVAGTAGNASSYYVRIAGKNLVNTSTATARIDRPLFNNNKYGVLGIAVANNSLGEPSSLIVGSPRGAQTLGIGFNPSQFNSSNYLLYLVLYPSGNPSDGYTVLPAIDVTGNAGLTPGSYTLDSVVAATNAAFRQPGFNYRFIAFQFEGEFGIMLADSYNNASFSIANMAITTQGAFDPTNTLLQFPNSVVGNIANPTPDPLGFGPLGSNIGSPLFASSYGSAAAAQFPTKLLVPLSRNNFYVNGAEEQRLNLEVGQALDGYGDGYWVATVTSSTPISGPNGHVSVVYTIPLDLATSDLKIGKTIVVQSLGAGTLTDFGRFIINNVEFTCGSTPSTSIMVYDAVHATGVSPSPTVAVGSKVAIYFCSDSVSFNAENSSDITVLPSVPPFKRHFEVYIDDQANTYTQERARFSLGGTTVTVNSAPLYGSVPLSNLNIVSVSPKLQGYNFGISKINLQIFSYDQNTGIYDGYLCRYDGVSATHVGELVFGQTGIVTRFYDETNIDYIDVIFPAATSSANVIASFGATNIDIQLFPTLSLDQEIMLMGTCQFNDANYQITYNSDQRQFGNISEQQLSSSAIDFIEAPTREFQENGIIRGFDITGQTSNTVSFSGGTAVINGKIVQVNPQTVTIPAIFEALPASSGGLPSLTSTVNTIVWFVCVNENAEIELVASTDYDPNGVFAAQYVAAGVNHLRLFYAMNPNAISPTTYQIRGTYLSSLVLTQTDITLVATVISQVTNPGSGFAVTFLDVGDARRYVTGGYGGLAEPFTLGVEASFRSPISLNNWLILLNNFVSAVSPQANAISNKVIVKGHVDVDFPFYFGCTYADIYIEGDGGVFDVYVPTGIVLSDNVHLNNLTFNYIYDPTVVVDPAVLVALSGTFTLSGSTTVATSSSQVGVLSKGSVVGFSGQPGILFTVTSVSPTSISVNTATSSVVGASIGYSNGYNTTDLINTGNGLIFMNVTTANRGISITNCHFNWNPIVANTAPLYAPSSSTSINRHSFINIQLAQPTVTLATILQQVNISDNTFEDGTLSSFTAGALETARAAISFVSTSNSASFGYNIKMIDVVVRNNICDKDQMIAIAPTYSTTPGTIVNTINATNVLIESNTCGSIAAFTQYFAPFDANNTLTFSFLNLTLDKNNGIIIRGNTCKYIHSTDSTGQDISYPTATSVGVMGTGPMIVADNTTSWIKLPLAAGVCPCVIKNNTLTAYDTAFLKLFGGISSVNGFNSAINIDYIGTPAAFTAVNTPVIDGNMINEGIYNTITPEFTVFNYDIGIFVLYHDANIGNNFIANLAQVASSINPIGVYLDTLQYVSVSSNVHHNKFYRVATAWTSYVNVGTVGTHSITDNFFDQLNPFGAAWVGTPLPANFQNQITGNITACTIRGNINQVLTEAYALMEDKAFYSSPVGTPPGATVTGPAFPAVDGYFDVGNVVGIARYTHINLPSVVSTSMNTVVYEGTSLTIGPLQRNVSFSIPLSAYLPPGVRLLSIQLGVWLQLIGSATLNTSSQANNCITLTMNMYNNNATSGVAGAGMWDVKNNISPLEIFYGTDYTLNTSYTDTVLIGTSTSSGENANGPYNVILPATIQNATYPLIIYPNQVVGSNYRISVEIDLNYLRETNVSGNIINWFFSPLVVAYTYGTTSTL